MHEAVEFITACMTRPPSPANEVQTAVAKAYSSDFRLSATRLLASRAASRPAPIPIIDIRFDPAKLEAFAKRINSPRNWRHWLWERSPERPDAISAWSFLAHLYRPGEIVLVFDKMESKTPLQSVSITQPMDCRVPAGIQAGGRYGAGIWFLCNPVDGGWHCNPRQNNSLSCRSEEAITAFRYGVLESDRASARLWLAFVVQLPLRIAAIYASGGRSIHCLFRLDAPSKPDWDYVVTPLKRPLKVMGADPACLSAVRLTRLPQCWRPENGGFQQLLYLCPNPTGARLVDLPVIRSRSDTLISMKHTCCGENRDVEAYQ